MLQVKKLEAYVNRDTEIPLVDVRSEGEFAQGHFPGSINIPLLNNAHRIEVGTLYKRDGKEAAVMKGFQLAGPKFYELFKEVRKSAKNQEVFFYCWRGGMRSQIMAWMMNLADYKVSLLEGGYKSYRRFAHELFAQKWKWIIVSGKTGVGKTKILQQLAERGEQVLDYEAISNHRGSAFGQIGLPPQPTVEQFENLLAWKLKDFDASKPVWIENESRSLGKVRIPDDLFNQAMDSPMVELLRNEEERRTIILDEYAVLPQEALLESTQRLQKKLGGDRMKIACDALLAGDWQGWLDILIPYYDKTYGHSRSLRTGKAIELSVTGDGSQCIDELISMKNQLWKT